MNTSLRFLLSGFLITMMGGIYSTNAFAGFMDKINQVTGRINQTSQQVDQVNRAKQQVETMGSKLPKPKAKNKSEEETAPEGFELTKTSNPIKGEWGTQEKACAVNSATCQNALTDFSNCMHQTKGYYFRLIAAHLKGRLDNEQDLMEEDRTMLEEDIASLNEAVTTDKVIDPDPEYPARYMAWLTDDDQHDLQKLNGKYMNEVRDDCDKRFGGMNH